MQISLTILAYAARPSLSAASLCVPSEGKEETNEHTCTNAEMSRHRRAPMFWETWEKLGACFAELPLGQGSQ